MANVMPIAHQTYRVKPAVYAMAAYPTKTAELYPDMWWEMPDSHQGILPPAVKKSRASRMRDFAQMPMAIITTK